MASTLQMIQKPRISKLQAWQEHDATQDTNELADINVESIATEKQNIFSSVINLSRTELPKSECLTKPESLKLWATNNNITQNSLGSLLELLREWLPHEGFPKDPRTLLKTPKKVEFLQVAGGSLYHFGVEKFVMLYLEKGGTCSTLEKYSCFKNVILISIGIDGLPLSKSSNVQFWPILGYINDYKSDIFVCSLFCGYSKPTIVSDFLRPFIDEMKELEENGVIYNDQVYVIKIRQIIADAPARSFIKCVKNHNAYYGCERCFRKGKWRRKVTYSGMKYAELYTDATFRDQTFDKHHAGVSPLIELNIGMISNIPLDYMHLCCLGVMKKLLVLWKEEVPHKLSPRCLKKISKRLCLVREYVPDTFNRKPRALDDLRHWKATEFRTFLLYVGPVTLKGIISETKFKHFLLFHTAIYILCSNANADYVQFAGSLLQKFVCDFNIVYANDLCVYNVHMLSHLHLDAMNHGRLDDFSAFPFENYMSSLKRKIRARRNFLAQVVNRISEEETNLFDDLTVCSMSVSFSRKERNNVYLTNEMKVCKIVAQHNSNEIFLAKVFSKCEQVDWYPITSGKLGIYIVSDLSENEFEISVSTLIRQCMLIEHKGINLCMPLCN